jgi:hypothetical protein
MTNNKARTIRVKVRTTLKELIGRLEAVKNDEWLAKDI